MVMDKKEEKELLAKARKGNVDAMFELGNLYSFEGNEEEANKWWKKAGRKGHKGAKSSRKGTLLGKRPMDGCTVFLLVLVAFIVAFIVAGFTIGWGNAFAGLFVLGAIVFFISTDNN